MEQEVTMLNLFNLMMDVKSDVKALGDNLHEEIQQVREDLHEEIQQVREDLHEEIQQVREDLHEEIQQVREDLHEEIQQVREDLHEEIQQVRQDLGAEMKEIRSEIQELRYDIIRLDRRVSHIELQLEQLQLYSWNDARRISFLERFFRYNKKINML